jgi:hypothetical protein
MAFAMLGSVGLLCTLLAALAMPETRPVEPAR